MSRCRCQSPLLDSGGGQRCGIRYVPVHRGRHEVPSPSSQTYSVFAIANQMPKGNATGVELPLWSTPLASDVGNPGSIVIGTAASSAVVPVASVAGIADLIDSVDSIAAAAFGDVHRVVEDGQTAEIVVLSRLVCGCVADLSNFEMADLVDIGRQGGVWPGTRSSAPVEFTEIDSVLRARELTLRETAIVVVANDVVRSVAL